MLFSVNLAACVIDVIVLLVTKALPSSFSFTSCACIVLLLSLYLAAVDMHDIRVDGDRIFIKNSIKDVELSPSQLDVFDIRKEKGCWCLIFTNLPHSDISITHENYDALQFLLAHARTTRITPMQFYDQTKDRYFADSWYLTPPE